MEYSLRRQQLFGYAKKFCLVSTTKQNNTALPSPGAQKMWPVTVSFWSATSDVKEKNLAYMPQFSSLIAGVRWSKLWNYVRTFRDVVWNYVSLDILGRFFGTSAIRSN